VTKSTTLNQNPPQPIEGKGGFGRKIIGYIYAKSIPKPAPTKLLTNCTSCDQNGGVIEGVVYLMES
jgi:hypothetical protein